MRLGKVHAKQQNVTAPSASFAEGTISARMTRTPE